MRRKSRGKVRDGGQQSWIADATASTWGTKHDIAGDDGVGSGGSTLVLG